MAGVHDIMDVTDGHLLGLLTSIAYGRLADTFGRRFALFLACTGEMMAFVWIMCVCKAFGWLLSPLEAVRSYTWEVERLIVRTCRLEQLRSSCRTGMGRRVVLLHRRRSTSGVCHAIHNDCGRCTGAQEVCHARNFPSQL
jgi:hypothetical protein